MWIAIHVYLCADLMHYMGDAWSYEMDPDLVFYKPHDSWYQLKQVKLLCLYEDLGLPHDKKKKKDGHMLEIIDLNVDPTNMMLTMSDESCGSVAAA